MSKFVKPKMSVADKINYYKKSIGNPYNTYTIIHGGPKQWQESMQNNKLTCEVPEGVIVVFMTPPDHINYGDRQDAFELASFFKNPNWVKTQGVKNNPPSSGVTDKEKNYLKYNVQFPTQSEERVSNWMRTDDNLIDKVQQTNDINEKLRMLRENDKKQKKGDEIIWMSQMFFPGDTIYDQYFVFDDPDKSVDSYLLGKPYTTKELLDDKYIQHLN